MRFAAIALGLVATACSIGALDGFSGAPIEDAGAPDASDAPDPADSAANEASADAPKPLAAGSSCAAIKAADAAAPDGRYRIEPSGGAPAFDAYCDMTADGGGWMLVTEPMIAEEKKQSVTVVHESDARGGVVLRVFANSNGCGDTEDNAYLAVIRDAPGWSQVRARFDYFGSSACWSILGGRHFDDPFDGNIVPFENAIDIARDALRMGGAAGDAFDGTTVRCDNDPNNFWHESRGLARRSVVAIGRRKTASVAAGLGTFASCVDPGPGTTSPTYWEHREVFIR